MALLEFLPEKSAFKTAAERDGGWTMDRSIAAETHNEMARFRASYHAVHGGEDYEPYEPYEFVDPLTERLREQAAEAEEREREEDMRDLYTDLGFS